MARCTRWFWGEILIHDEDVKAGPQALPGEGLA